MYKKILSLLLAVAALLSLAACGEKRSTPATLDTQKQTENDEPTESTVDGFLLKRDESVSLGTPSATLDPQAVYDSLTYTPEMFYGEYSLRGGDEAEDAFGANTQYFTWHYNDGLEKEYSVLPYRIQAGKNTLSLILNEIKGYNWMQLSYMSKTPSGSYSLDWAYCAYTVEGNKLILNVLDSFELDRETNTINYAFTDEVWEYTFAFRGRNLTLSTGGSMITLTSGLNIEGTDDRLHINNCLSPKSESICDIDIISFRYDPEDDYTGLYFETVDRESSYESIAVMEENGLFTFTLALEKSGNKSRQFVYFYCGNDGLVLTDGNHTYYYNDTRSNRNKDALSGYLSADQTERLDNISDSKLEAIVEKKEDLMADLVKAFEDADISVTVDEESGELAMDASVLFGGDSAVLTDEGKAFLNKFVSAYTAIVFSEKYDGFVAKTMIEGHTAPTSASTYETGLPLSVERANTVKDYCLSAETGVDTTRLAESLEAIGLSNSKPILDADGNVDMPASRRVSFRFIINLD